MKFKATELRQLTFSTGTFGYKKKDVNDFLLVASKDYFDYDKKIHKIETERTELEKEISYLSEQLDRNETEVVVLKNQLATQKMNDQSIVSSVKTVYGDTLDDYSLIQQVALSIEETALKEYNQKMDEAATYYRQQMDQITAEKRVAIQERNELITRMKTLEDLLFPMLEKTREQFSTIRQELEGMGPLGEGESDQ